MLISFEDRGRWCADLMISTNKNKVKEVWQAQYDFDLNGKVQMICETEQQCIDSSDISLFMNLKDICEAWQWQIDFISTY